MSATVIGEILFWIATVVILPCLSLLVVAGIVVGVIALIRKNRDKSS